MGEIVTTLHIVVLVALAFAGAYGGLLINRISRLEKTLDKMLETRASKEWVDDLHERFDKHHESGIKLREDIASFRGQTDSNIEGVKRRLSILEDDNIK